MTMKEAGKTILSANTLIPLSAIGVIAGAVFWLSSLYASVTALKTTVAAFEQRIMTIESQNVINADRMARIETKIDILIQAIDK